MERTENLIREVLGPCRADVRPLAFAVDAMIRRIFVQHMNIGDIKISAYIYPEVARELNKQPDAAARQVERLANRCWDRGDRSRLNEIIGKKLRDIESPRDILIYLAFYAHLGIPYYEAVQNRTDLMI